MRKLLVATFVGLLLAVGLAIAGAASDYSVYQRTLATFSESAIHSLLRPVSGA